MDHGSNRHQPIPVHLRVLSVTLVVTLVVSLGPNPARASADPSTTATASFIVRSGDAAQLRRQIRIHHGEVSKQLGDVVVVDLTAGDARDLAAAPGIEVTPDTPVALSTLTGTPHDATTAFTTTTGADRLVASGVDGRGVTVAVLDTGIDPSPDFGNRLIGGVDLTGGGRPLPGRLRAWDLRGRPDRR